jgi:phage-related protein
MKINITFLEEAEIFLDSLSDKAKRKILSDIRKTEAGLRGEWFRKMPGTDGIWEFRTLFNKTYYRLFAFWDSTSDQQSLIVCTHGLVKKTDKTPQGDIDKAERLKKEYSNEN